MVLNIIEFWTIVWLHKVYTYIIIKLKSKMKDGKVIYLQKFAIGYQ